MRRPYSFARGSRVPARTLNRIMDEQVGLVRATGAPVNGLDLVGEDGRDWSTPDGGLADGAVAVVDASVDWRGRSLRGRFVRLGADAQRLHGADAWRRNDPAQAFAVRLFDDGWTGSNAAPITAAPTLGAGVFAVVLDELGDAAHRAWLFARSTDGALCLLNATGAALFAELRVYGARAAPSAGGAAPSVPGLLAGDVATTDATWTTIVTLSPGVSTGLTLRGSVAAIRDDGTEAGGWEFTVRVRRPSSGNPVTGTAAFALAESDAVGWGVRVQTSGATTVVQVQGDGNVRWRAEVQATEARIA